MVASRDAHTATLLNNGKVLITGGNLNGNSLNTAELYDPTPGTFSSTGNMVSARASHTATLLNNGKVLITGVNQAELYDPTSGTFSSTGSMVSGAGPATLLNNGKVLITGGDTTASLYDPTSETFSSTGNMVTARDTIGNIIPYTANLLNNGKVLISGGYGELYVANNAGNNLTLKTAELYDPNLGTFSSTGNMFSTRATHRSISLSNGNVLIIGGIYLNKITVNYERLNTAEVYAP
jgi:hypothetical protein